MTITNANDHPFKVAIVKDTEGLFANSHPYKVSLEGGGGQEGRVVDELPEVGEPGYIYLVLKEESSEGNIYDEYMWVLLQDGETYGWEHIATTDEVEVPTIVQTTGTSTTDIMSQNAVTSMVYADPTDRQKVQIGANASSTGFNGSIAIGYGSGVSGGGSVAIGMSAVATGTSSGTIGAIAVGCQAEASYPYSIALGHESKTSAIGEMNIGVQFNHGYNGSNYRLLTGLYDPQNDHDAATKGYVDTAIAGAGVKELTSADYNYDPLNTGTNTAIALWMLDPGIYKIAESNTRIYYNTTTSEAPSTPGRTFIILETDNYYKAIINETDSSSADIIVYKTRISDGSNVKTYYILGTDDVVQTTGTSTTSIMSQKAVTDALATAGANTISSQDWSALWQ